MPEDHSTSPRATEADARIVIDDLLRRAGWDPRDKSQVATEVTSTPATGPGAVVDRSRARPFETHAPVYDLIAAAGAFGSDHAVGGAEEEIGWAPVPASLRLTRDHFAARVEGRSMEPTIPDGPWCRFRAERGGTRAGKTVLVWHRGCTDPALGDTLYDPVCGTAGFLIDAVDHILARYSETPHEAPIYGEDWLEQRGQTLEEARREMPNLQTYRKGVGERLPDWKRLEGAIHGTDVSRQMMRIAWFHEVRNDGYDPDKIQGGGRPEIPEKNDILGLLAAWTDQKDSRFEKPPGVEAGSVLDPGSEEPRSWWAKFETVFHSDFSLAASRYKPRIAEEIPDDDTADLIREDLPIEKEIADGLEKRLQEVES